MKVPIERWLAAPMALPRAEARALSKAWRRRFVPEVLERTGRGVHLGYDWHAFSYGFTQALEGAAALEAYRQLPPGELLILSAWTHAEFGYRCTGAPPDLSEARLDVRITDPDLSWTMVFTHERTLGPYFRRAPA